ncbi:MAG: ribosomal protein S18-alanine N-acetyltransferase [Magnetococcales bacterium]|nr:ribosomal protein S18-alanine N-acetyltransferase [Magnetococcales bacterium]
MMRSRAMLSSDLDAVAALEARLTPQPWSTSMLADELRQGSFCRVLVTDAEKQVGYALLRPLLDEWHLMAIGIDQAWQGCGWGGFLLHEAIRHAVEHQGRVLLLEVRLSNLPAQRLYASLGFRLLHRRRHYYRTPLPEDALVMELPLDSKTGIHPYPPPDHAPLIVK